MPDYQLADRYQKDQGTVLLSGIQALARLPIEQLRLDQRAGRKTAAFVSGYPGSPLGGLDMELQRALRVAADLPIVHEPAVNEELAATAVMGSQLAAARPDARYEGVVGMWYGKAPGLDRAGDALRHGVFAGSSPLGGAVVLVGDDPACKSSTMPSSSDATLVDLHMPILYPGTVAECLELGLHAVAISRATGLWASMKIVTPIADGSGTVVLPAMTEPPLMPTVEVDGKVWQSTPSAQFLGPRMLEVEREFREVRLPLATEYGIRNKLNRIAIDPPDPWLGIVATGFTYNQTLDALRRLGLPTAADVERAGIRLLQLRMPVPFDADLVRRFAEGLDEILIVEEKNPTLEWLVKDALYGSANTPAVYGKTARDGSQLFRSWGLLDADAIVDPLRRALAPRIGDRLVPEQPARQKQLIPLAVNRTPFFCSGCPHNWGTKVPDDALVGAGTGCHGMTLLMDPERVGEGIGITAMGNEGTQWIGMEPFVEAEHLFQNYGDGTFFHSAQLALQNCIGAGKHMTFKILFNSTVAMTGGQDSQSGLDIQSLVAMLQAIGVAKVAITTEDLDRYQTIALPAEVTVRDRSRIVETQEELRTVPGVTVLIHDQECAAELRRDRRRGTIETPKKRILINHRICEGCGDCGDVSNCLSVQPTETPFGRKTKIDQASCNFDYSCVEGDCPAFMTIEGDGVSASMPDAGAVDVSLPVPTPRADRDSVRIRMAGIGGTGVVTAAQIIGTAAMFDGWEVNGLDQTGLSQKAGPVISDLVLHRGDSWASNVVGRGEADLILAFDALVAAGDAALSAAGPTSVVVASSTKTPTGKMITEPALPYPVSATGQRLRDRTHAGAVRSLDAAALATALTGSAAQANLLLVGVAVQSGDLPISIAAIEQAIELNGVAVAANLSALHWGRHWVVDATAVEDTAVEVTAVDVTAVDVTAVERATSGEAGAGANAGERANVGGSAGGSPSATPHRKLSDRIDSLALPADLVDRLRLLSHDLHGYQDLAYATGFLDRVEEITVAERQTVGAVGPLTETFANSLHKLLAYKDEYEVARLMLDPSVHEQAKAVGGVDATVSWQLHPPMLKALGMQSKISVGSWATPGIRTLAKLKKLRGTSVDPFGRTEMRRLERSLPAEFIAAMNTVRHHLNTDNLDAAVEIAGLADQVRGYEALKLRRAAAFRTELEVAVTRFASVNQQD